MRYCKLTNENFETTNHTKWGENVTHKVLGKGCRLCTADVIHVYDHPLKAVFFNPIHAKTQNPVLWECRVKNVVAKDNTKVGVKTCTTIRQIPLPDITLNQRVRVAIYCALAIYHDEGFIKWANGWLDGSDRTAGAAYSAANAAQAAYADYIAAQAAYSAAYAAQAAYSAAYAAGAAFSAAEAAQAVSDIIAIIKRAIQEED